MELKTDTEKSSDSDIYPDNHFREDVIIEKRKRGRPQKYHSEEEKREMNKIYYKNFVANNNIIDKARKCEICGGKISHYYNKSHHNATQKHIKAVSNKKL